MTISIRRRSEPVPIGLLLAAVGGYLDAYTYVGHGGVFANAQTGNVVLLAVGAIRGDGDAVLRHLRPLLAFVLGLCMAEVLARPRARALLRRPTRVVLVVEAVVLAACALWTPSDDVVTAAVAFVAALQVSTFRLVGDVAYNTTITTGNLRAFVSALARWCGERAPGSGRRAAVLAAVVIAFGLGAAAGAALTSGWGAIAAWVPAAAVVLVLAAIVIETHCYERRAKPTR